MVRVEAGINPPLMSENPCACPGKKAREQQKQNGQRGPPNTRRPFPKLALPQNRIGDNDQQYAPAGTRIDFLGGLGVSFGQQKWRQPDEPSYCKNDVCIGWHAAIITSPLRQVSRPKPAQRNRAPAPPLTPGLSFAKTTLCYRLGLVLFRNQPLQCLAVRAQQLRDASVVDAWPR